MGNSASKQLHPHGTAREKVDLDLLISGYIRETEKEFKLYTNIQTGIDRIIHKFYPKLLFKFGVDNLKNESFLGNIPLRHFNEDRTTLTGNDPSARQCIKRVTYADLANYNKTGLSKGIHTWSIKNLQMNERMRRNWYIGVVTEKNDKLVEAWDKGSRGHSPLLGGNNNPDPKANKRPFCNYQGTAIQSIATIKLDCNEWNVAFYRDKMELKKVKIEANKSYFLAIFCCGHAYHSCYQVVEDVDV